jgi:hypothetical protein
MPQTTVVGMPQEEEQAQMPTALRRSSYGYLLTLPVLLLGAAGHTPAGRAVGAS